MSENAFVDFCGERGKKKEKTNYTFTYNNVLLILQYLHGPLEDHTYALLYKEIVFTLWSDTQAIMSFCMYIYIYIHVHFLFIFFFKVMQV